MGPPWWGWLALVFSGILAFLFIVGSYFEIRRFLRKMKQHAKPEGTQAQQKNR